MEGFIVYKLYANYALYFAGISKPLTKRRIEAVHVSTEEDAKQIARLLGDFKIIKKGW